MFIDFRIPKHPVVYEPVAGVLGSQQTKTTWNWGACILWSLSILIDLYLVDLTQKITSHALN